MPLRSTLTADVDDSSFRAYKAVFDKYAAAVARLPGDWAKVGKGVGDSRKAFDDLVAQMVHQNVLAAQSNAAQQVADRLVKSQAVQWKSMVQSTGNIVKTVVHATENLIKWVGPLAVVTGLLGAAGGLFGLERLAANVAGGRRSAMGIGAGYGQIAAFGLNYSPLIDATSLLGNVSRGVYDKTSPQYNALLSAGLSPEFIASHNPAEVSQEFLHRLPGKLAGVPRGLTTATGYGFENLISDQDLIAYMAAGPRERAEREQAWTKDARSLNLNNPTMKAYADFVNQLDRSGKQIEAVFVRGLAPLTAPLGRVSDALVKLVTDTAGSDEFKRLMDSIGGAIESLATYIQTPEFEKKVEDFGAWVGQMAGSLKWAVEQLIALGGGGKAASGRVDAQGFTHGATTLHRPGGRHAPAGSSMAPFHGRGGAPLGSSAGNLTRLIDEAAARHGVNPQIMQGIRAGESLHAARYDVKDDAIESSWGPFQLNRRSGLGVQFEKDTGLDLRDPRTIPAQADWVAAYLARGGSLAPWAGYHGPRAADPAWGDSGYAPTPIAGAYTDQYGNLRLRGSSGSATEPISGGPAARGLIDLAHWLQDSDPHLQQFTALRDSFHAGRPSFHNQGLAFDAVLSGESIDGAAARVRAQMAAAGLKEGGMGGGGDYAIEPSAQSQNHLHVQFNTADAAERFYAFRHRNASDKDEPGPKSALTRPLRVWRGTERAGKWETLGVDPPEGGWGPDLDFRKYEEDKPSPRDHAPVARDFRKTAPPKDDVFKIYEGAGVPPLLTINNHLGSGATVTTRQARWDR